MALETPFTAFLYPENAPNSMSVGEGLVWELLAMQWPVALRICLSKRSASVRAAGEERCCDALQ